MNSDAKGFLILCLGIFLLAAAYRVINPSRADQYQAVWPGWHYLMKPNGDVYVRRGMWEFGRGDSLRKVGNFWKASPADPFGDALRDSS